jgi:hypothetical protein
MLLAATRAYLAFSTLQSAFGLVTYGNARAFLSAFCFSWKWTLSKTKSVVFVLDEFPVSEDHNLRTTITGHFPFPR